MRMFRFVLTLAALLMGGVAVHTLHERGRLVLLFTTERDCLRLNTYWEAAREPEAGQRMVAWVTKMRAADGKRYHGGRTICKVVWHKRVKPGGKVVPEFSWTILPAAQRIPADEAAWRRASAAADAVYDGAWKSEGDLWYARYYLRPEHSRQHNVCWFKKSLVAVGVVGRHHFYREPQSERERVQLLRRKPQECQPEKKKKQDAPAQRQARR